MNMQNKLYTMSFFYHLMTDSQPVPKQQSQNSENWILQNSQKRSNSWESLNSQPREDSNSQKQKN